MCGVLKMPRSVRCIVQSFMVRIKISSIRMVRSRQRFLLMIKGHDARFVYSDLPLCGYCIRCSSLGVICIAFRRAVGADPQKMVGSALI